MTEVENFANDNQSIFIEDDAIYSSRELKPIKKPKYTLLVIVGVIVVILLLIALFISRGGGTPTLEDSKVTPTPQPTSQHTPTQIDGMISELELLLNDADPAQTSQTFPPITKEILLSD